jgi:hypothetical protein
MIGGPLLYTTIGMSGIFMLTGALSLLAIGVVVKAVPAAPAIPRQPAWPSFVEVLTNRQLLRLNFGVFALHLMITAMWVVVPSELTSTGGLPVAEHWKIYLLALLFSFALMVPAIIAAERHGRMKMVFNMAIMLLLAAQVGFAILAHGLYALAFWLTVFLKMNKV